MFTRRKAALTILSVLSAVIPMLPAQAQHSIEPSQPVVGSLHVREANLDFQLTHDYTAGLIDPLELANMRRDLDAIEVKEESYRMRAQGLSASAESKIAARLDLFQARLLEKVGDKGRIATATYTEIR